MGPELPLSSLSRSLNHQAATPACLHGPKNAQLFLLLAPALAAQAHSLCRLLPDDASTSLGCKAEKFPRWQPLKPPSLRHRRHSDQHRGPDRSCDMLSAEQNKEDVFAVFSSPGDNISNSEAHFMASTSSSSQPCHTHTNWALLHGEETNTHMHGKKNTFKKKKEKHIR